MANSSLRCGGFVFLMTSILVAGCDGSKPASTPTALAVPKVTKCAAGDHPEPGLQGQVPAAIRANGFNGFNCNLALEGQHAGDGGFVSFASLKDDHGHACAYYHGGTETIVVDITDAAKPVRTASLTSPAMRDPWETLRVNARRQILAAARSVNGGVTEGPEVDFYDLSADCRDPKLLSSVAVGTGNDGGIAAPKPVRGHEANFAPDGLTFYIGDSYGKTYSAIDLTDPTKPKFIAQMDLTTGPLHAAGQFNGQAHGLSVSMDGNRGYFTSVGMPKLADLTNPEAHLSDGFYVVDTSEVQARKPDARMKIISHLAFRDGAGAQHTLSIKIGGKPHLVFVDEMGSGGVSALSGASLQATCDAGLTPFPMGRIIDMSDETKPKQISTLGLETHELANCGKVIPDTVGEGIFTYGSHFCSVDNRENATALACGYWQSGVRVFDIRNPAKPKEIAYYNPAPVIAGKMSVGSGSTSSSAVNSCGSTAAFDFERKLLTTMCSRSGVLVLKFENGVWPMPESTPAARNVSYN